MPRGQKSKLRAREKRRQARGEPQSLEGTQATAANVEESSDSPVSGDTLPSPPAAGTSQEPQGSPATSSPTAGVSHPRSNVGASTSPENAHKDLLTRKVGMLMQFLLEKYTMRAPILKSDMLKIIHKRYKEHFPEILRKASEHMELVFGLELKEVKPGRHSYILVSSLDLTADGNVSSAWGFPKNGLLMPLLSVIFLSGNRASEKDIWEFLNILGIYDGRKHLVFGDPRKLITQDLVQEKYLEYRQAPGSDPPRFEFLWGPRAHAETSKMRVLEFLAKVHDTNVYLDLESKFINDIDHTLLFIRFKSKSFGVV
uniref:MAGE domain-containing protein n=1 Tax=Neovison vison TaxID=452646 RepID=A0A8C7ETN2_NEOVI